MLGPGYLQLIFTMELSTERNKFPEAKPSRPKVVPKVQLKVQPVRVQLTPKPSENLVVKQGKYNYFSPSDGISWPFL
jgi:hypothetical protein